MSFAGKCTSKSPLINVKGGEPRRTQRCVRPCCQGTERPPKAAPSHGSDHYDRFKDHRDLVYNTYTFFCEICALKCPPKKGVVLKCKHAFCKSCLATYIEESKDLEIKCPYIDEELSCPNIIHDFEIRELIDEDHYNEYIQRSIDKIKAETNNAYFCKTLRCKGWCIDESGDDDKEPLIFYCPLCSKENCLFCKAIHEDMTCAEYLQGEGRFDKSKKAEKFVRPVHPGDVQDLVYNTKTFKCKLCAKFCRRGRGVVLRCYHAFCEKCLSQYIEHSEEPEIICPFIDGNFHCKNVILDCEIKELVNEDVYDDYVNKSINYIKGTTNNAFFCKTPRCKGWCIDDNLDDGEEPAVFDCPICLWSNCLFCKAIHEGMSCDEYLEGQGREKDRKERKRRYKPRKPHMIVQDLVYNEIEFECAICSEICKPGKGVVLSCYHSFCKKCLAEFVENSDEPEIFCPYTDGNFHCQNTLLDCEIIELIDEEAYNKYVDRSIDRIKATNKNAYFCKTPKCKGWCIDDGEDHWEEPEVFNCPLCKRINCLFCKAIHEDITCDEYLEGMGRLEDRKIRAERFRPRETPDKVQDLVYNVKAFRCKLCRRGCMPGKGVVLKCHHAFCEKCLSKYVKASKEPEIFCPFVDGKFRCKTVLLDCEIRELVDEDVYNDYVDRSIEYIKANADDAYFCKTPHCKGWCIDDGEDDGGEPKIFDCPLCLRSNCLSCKAIHEGISCDEYLDGQGRQNNRRGRGHGNNLRRRRSIDPDQDLVYNSKPFKCPICTRICKPGNGVVLRCHHYFCKSCLANFIECSDEPQIVCPFTSGVFRCDSIINDYEIRELLDECAYKEYVERSIKKAKETMENAYFCKTPNCRGWCIFDDFTIVFKCPICRKENCLICKDVHEGLTCEEYNIIRKDMLVPPPKLKPTVCEKNEKLVYNDREIYCPVCATDFEPGRAVIFQCQHAFCTGCLEKYITTHTEPRIKCLKKYCKYHLQDYEIKELVGQDGYDDYVERSRKVPHITSKNTYFCKTPNCRGWCVINSKNVKEFKCRICSKINCVVCQVIHEGMTCNEYLESRCFYRPTNVINDKFHCVKLTDCVKPEHHHECDKDKDNDQVDIDIRTGIQEQDKYSAMTCTECECLVEKNDDTDWLICQNCQTELCWATKGPRWGPQGRGDFSGGCQCRVNGVKCAITCRNCS